MNLSLTTRNASLAELAALLQDQQARKLDVVAPAGNIRSVGGVLHLDDTEPVLDESGVTTSTGRYVPTVVCDEGIADKLGVPIAYLKRLRAERPDLYDSNVNGWLHGTDPLGLGPDFRHVPTSDAPGSSPDPRSFLIRCFRGDEGDGIARAFLSQRFGMIDNLDVLTAAMDGVRQAGVTVNILGCDLSERRMYVRVQAPEVMADGSRLLERYRAPNGRMGRDDPRVLAGFVISNSETGGGAFTIVPRLLVVVCSNGIVQEKDALRTIHLGGKMNEGVVKWSDDTMRKELQTVTAKARDAVAAFLDPAYVEKAVRELEEKSSTPVSSGVVEIVGQRLRFSKDQTQGVLDFFIDGADRTAGGVLQAVTAYAGTVSDPDEAHELESVAVKAMETAAAL